MFQAKGIIMRLLRPQMFEQVTGIVQDILFIYIGSNQEEDSGIFRELFFLVGHMLPVKLCII